MFPRAVSRVSSAPVVCLRLGNLQKDDDACISDMSFLFACDPASFLCPATRSASRSGIRDKLNRPLEGKGVRNGQEALRWEPFL
jgi:hypothetical protein